jgi:hypothetical protein
MKRKFILFSFLRYWPELYKNFKTFTIDDKGPLCPRLFYKNAFKTRIARRLAKLRKVVRRDIYQARVFEESSFYIFTETFIDHIISAISFKNKAFSVISIKR